MIALTPSSQYANEQILCFRPFFYLVAILCRGGFRLVAGFVLWLVVVVGEVSG